MRRQRGSNVLYEPDYAASELPQLAQKRDAGASTTAPHVAHVPLRYFPQDEQNTGSGSGRGPHVSQDRRIVRYRSTAASAASAESAAAWAPPTVGLTTTRAEEPASAATFSRRERNSTKAERVYVALRDV